jgi:hypothetical protein
MHACMHACMHLNSRKLHHFMGEEKERKGRCIESESTSSYLEDIACLINLNHEIGDHTIGD